MDPADRVIVALDAPTTDANLALMDHLSGIARWYKLGMRQFYADPAPIRAALQAQGARLFLDLKLHDIPATVAGAIKALAPWRPALLTVHAAGGVEMIRAAVEAASDAGLAETQILAVTVLTSLDAAELQRLGLGSAEDTATRWARLALDAGAHGLVCSAHEAATLRALAPDATLVTPGIRLAGGAHHDQKRVMTPGRAVASGADYLVLGRAIGQADRPAQAFGEVIRAVEEGR